MENVTFIPSGRGGRKALYMGFTFTKHRETATGSAWHCKERHSGCKARLKINSAETALEVVREHTHLPDFGAVKAMKLLAVLLHSLNLIF